MKRGDYSHYSIEQRKKLFNAIYQFSRRITAKYSSVVVDKRFINKTPQLRYKLKSEIENLMQNNIEYFNKFDKIVLYYDNGQTMLGRVLNSVFQKFENFEHKVKFDKREKRLFQVSDMLTYIDKYDYKYKNKINFTNGEKYFFKEIDIRKIMKELKKKKF